MDNKKNLLIISSLAVIFISLIAFFVWQNNSQDNQDNPVAAPVIDLSAQVSTPAEDDVFVATSSVVNIVVDAENGCQPNKIKIKANQQMTLSLSSTERDVRTMKFDDSELGIPVTSVGPGDTRDAIFTAYKKGEYKFSCGPADKTDGYKTGTLIID